MNKQAHCSNVAWAACLGYTELAFMLWRFKLDNSLLRRGSVEGHFSVLCLHPEYLLPTVGSSWSMDLAVHVLREFIKGLVVFSAAGHIRLL